MCVCVGGGDLLSVWGGFWALICQNPSVFKPKWLQVVIFWYFFNF